MKSIYYSDKGKEAVLELYDRQIASLPCHCDDIYLPTAYGSTHLIETGNLQGVPLLVFHGGNMTTAYNLKDCEFLMEKFHIYAVDTIGHPGKSAETCLSPKSYEYGEWVSEVITGLGYEKMRCLGESFGGGVLVKAMCVAPEKIERAVLLVPAAIKNGAAVKIMSMLEPMIMYRLTKKEEWLRKCLMPMALEEEKLEEEMVETAKCSIDNVRMKIGMPSDVETDKLRECTMPVYVLAAELDRLFPGRGVLKRVRKTVPHCKGHLLKGRGHIHKLTVGEKRSIVRFLEK